MLTYDILPDNRMLIYNCDTGATATVLQLYPQPDLPIDHVARVAFAEWYATYRESDAPVGCLHLVKLAVTCALAAMLWTAIYIMIPA